MAFDPSDSVHQHIDSLVKQHDLLLFMKGTRIFPQCGFSATVVGLLDELGQGYHTVNVLADQSVREGIKAYSDWPTIPQLYVKGEFVGGCDIVKGMYASGELHKLLGVEVAEVPTPTVTISETAAEVLRDAAAKEKHKALRIEISPKFQYGLRFDADRPGDLVAEAGGLTLLFDRGSAQRADGLRLDYSQLAGGFSIDNPNEPPKVKQITVRDLKRVLDDNPRVHLFDVRTEEERAIAQIPRARLMTPVVREEAMKLPKDTPLYFHCHHGGRSNSLAEAFLAAGFTNVSNVHGGIDAWAREIDPSVSRY